MVYSFILLTARERVTGTTIMNLQKALISLYKCYMLNFNRIESVNLKWNKSSLAMVIENINSFSDFNHIQ